MLMWEKEREEGEGEGWRLRSHQCSLSIPGAGEGGPFSICLTFIMHPAGPASFVIEDLYSAPIADSS